MILDLINTHVVQLRAAGVIDNRDAANVCFWFSVYINYHDYDYLLPNTHL